MAKQMVTKVAPPIMEPNLLRVGGDEKTRPRQVSMRFVCILTDASTMW